MTCVVTVSRSEGTPGPRGQQVSRSNPITETPVLLARAGTEELLRFKSAGRPENLTAAGSDSFHTRDVSA